MARWILHTLKNGMLIMVVGDLRKERKKNFSNGFANFACVYAVFIASKVRNVYIVNLLAGCIKDGQ